jgi:hypothetical protein
MAGLAIHEVRHLRFLVHGTSHPVTDEFPHHIETVTLDAALDGGRDAGHDIPDPSLRNSFVKSLFGHIQELNPL